MRQPRLFEFLDFAWSPASLRDAATDDLRFKWERGGLYKPIAVRLARLLTVTGSGDVLDLASGGGGPIWAVYRRLADDGATVGLPETDPSRRGRPDPFPRRIAGVGKQRLPVSAPRRCVGTVDTEVE